jgi:hypothetical protein
LRSRKAPYPGQAWVWVFETSAGAQRASSKPGAIQPSGACRAVFMSREVRRSTLPPVRSARIITAVAISCSLGSLNPEGSLTRTAIRCRPAANLWRVSAIGATP